jgi:hypothetical protein
MTVAESVLLKYSWIHSIIGSSNQDLIIYKIEKYQSLECLHSLALSCISRLLCIKLTDINQGRICEGEKNEPVFTNSVFASYFHAFTACHFTQSGII